MNRIVLASIRRNIGKTSLILGIGKTVRKKLGYIKPFGDRLVYKRKRMWDHDSALIASIFDLKYQPEDITIGFDQSKLRHMYDKNDIGERLRSIAEMAEKNCDFLMIEAGKDFSYGSSIYLDPVSIALATDAKLIVVTGSNETVAFDDAHLIKKYLDYTGVKFGGVVLNKIPNLEDFKQTYLPEYKELGVPVLGAIPYEPELTYFSVDQIVEHLTAKVICGESNLGNKIREVFIGAMSADAVLRYPRFQSENKMVITAGDRSDMLLAALDGSCACVVLTNDTIPPPNIISRYEERNVPLLLVRWDTYTVAKKIDNIMPLVRGEDPDNLAIIEKLVSEHVDMEKLLA